MYFIASEKILIDWKLTLWVVPIYFPFTTSIIDQTSTKLRPLFATLLDAMCKHYAIKAKVFSATCVVQGEQSIANRVFLNTFYWGGFRDWVIFNFLYFNQIFIMQTIQIEKSHDIVR